MPRPKPLDVDEDDRDDRPRRRRDPDPLHFPLWTVGKWTAFAAGCLFMLLALAQAAPWAGRVRRDGVLLRDRGPLGAGRGAPALDGRIF